MRDWRKLSFISVLALWGTYSVSQSATASIEGSVTRIGTNGPLPGVRIQLSGGPVGTTNEQGTFKISDIAAGTYSVTVQREGFFLAGIDDTTAALRARSEGPPPAGRPPIPIGEITVAAGQQIKNFHVEMKSVDGVISGVVRGPDGEPMPGIAISLRRAAYDNAKRYLSVVPPPYSGSLRTNDRGEYRAYELPSGEYYVLAIVPPALGRNTFHPASPWSADAKAVIVRDGETISGIDIEVQRLPRVTLSGTAIPDPPAAPILTYVVTPVPRNPDVPLPTPADLLVPGVAVTARQFTIDVSVLKPDTYDLFVDGVTTDGGLSGSIPVFISGRPIEGLEIPIRAGVDLNAKVIVRDGDFASLKFTNAPIRLEGLSNRAYNSTSRLAAQGIAAMAQAERDGKALDPASLNRSSLPNASGEFLLRSIPPGLYGFRTTLPQGAYLVDVLQKEKSLLGSGLQIDVDTPAPIEVVVGMKTASIEGILGNKSGQGLGFSTVVLVPNLERRNNFDLYRTTSSNYAGQFSFAGIPPGAYKLFAWQAVPSGLWTSVTAMKPFEPLGTDAVVGESAVLRNLTVTQIVR